MTSDALLASIGARVRALRVSRSWSTADLARRSGLSQRYLFELEHGRGNISVVRLSEVAQALETSLATIVGGLGPRGDAADRLAGLHGAAQQRALRAAAPPAAIALVGLRGAGKSTVGERLAVRLSCPFHELDALVESRAGVRLAALFGGGEASRYRELERSVLGELIARGSACVIATGGSLVTDEATWAMLRASARTVWLRARPEDHLARVEAQGDTRPMAGRADALAELRDILDARTPAYERAEARVDTHGIAVELVVERIVEELALTPEPADRAV